MPHVSAGQQAAILTLDAFKLIQKRGQQHVYQGKKEKAA